MAKRKVGRFNEVSVDLTKYDYYLRGEGGIGKTTLAYELGKKYGPDTLLILEVGQENGIEHLPGAFSDHAKSWSDLVEIIDVLVEERNTEFKNTKIICIDSTDELFRLAEAEVIRLHNRECQPDKRTRSINGAFGGFNRGVEKAADIVIENVWRLKDAGYSLFFIGHTKVKTKRDPLTEIEFEQLTTNMNAKYDNAIKDKVYITATAYVKREIDREKNRIVSEERVIAFRDQSFAIDTKSRFSNIQGIIPFSTDAFVSAIENAIKSQIEEKLGKAAIPTPVNPVEEVTEEPKPTITKDEIIAFLKANYGATSTATKNEIMGLLAENNIKKIDEASLELLLRFKSIVEND